jgi:hypothetical protein
MGGKSEVGFSKGEECYWRRVNRKKLFQLHKLTIVNQYIKFSINIYLN